MAKPMIRIHDLATNEVIDREMNDEEFSQHQKDIAESLEQKLLDKTSITVKQTVLDKLGLSADEVAALLG